MKTAFDLKTVGELKKALASYDDKLPLVLYDRQNNHFVRAWIAEAGGGVLLRTFTQGWVEHDPEEFSERKVAA